ncbi:MAG: molybdopterin molybdotransferase MoeA [Rhodocyclaceae bacterium]|nr:molybdopterin molybdotransferase MoeA [Rhodocyclaceae bacterium]
MHSDPGCTGDEPDGVLDPAAVRAAMLARIEPVAGVDRVVLWHARSRVLGARQGGLPAGRRVGVADVAALAEAGCAELSVHRRPRVAVLCTGDELRPLGSLLEPGQIHDSNRYLLAGLMAGCGVDVLDAGTVADRIVALRDRLVEVATDCDAVVTTGGASAGEADLMGEAIAASGELLIRRVAMRPGRPMAFGRIDGAWVFSLAGKPSGVMAAFLCFVGDALRRLGGERVLPAWPRLPATLAEAVTKNHRRGEFVQGILFERNGQWLVRPSRVEGGRLCSMSAANCYIVVAPEQTRLSAGQRVPVHFFGGRA